MKFSSRVKFLRASAFAAASIMISACQTPERSADPAKAEPAQKPAEPQTAKVESPAPKTASEAAKPASAVQAPAPTQAAPKPAEPAADNIVKTPTPAPDVPKTDYKSFNPGKLLLDEDGRIVNAHGAGFIRDNGKYYMFGEHRMGGELGRKSLVGVRCYSSDDLYNWKDEGVALKMSSDPKSDIFIGSILERPKVIYNPKTKKYVMWMHIERRKAPTAHSANLDDIAAEKPDYSSARIGLAVSDKITGPYSYVKSFRPNAKKYPVGEEKKLRDVRTLLVLKDPDMRYITLDNYRKGKYGIDEIFIRDFDKGQMARDFTAFVDDGKAYIICASEENGTLQIHELSDDYQNFTGKFARAFKGGFNEAPAIFKKGGKYFMITSGCTGWKANAARLSSADSVLGEWKDLGNPCRGTPEETSSTFNAQSTYVIPVAEKDGAFVFVADRWKSDDLMDSRIIFLPVEWENGLPVLRWRDSWDMKVFDEKPAQPLSAPAAAPIK